MMEQEKFDGLNAYIKTILHKWDIKDLVAEVHNLYQEYIISDEQEDELYNLVDPDDMESSPAELWYGNHGCVDIWNFVQ